MCGIAGVHFKKGRAGLTKAQVEKLVDELLLGIEARGRHATGILSVSENGQTNLQKKDKTAWSFIQKRSKLPRNVRTILLHTRFATQGSPTVMANNHPVKYRSVFITHNGHISNDQELFEEFGLPRKAEVDSEAIAMLIHKEGMEKVHRALQELEGGFAIAAVDPLRAPGQLVLAKGYGSPLHVVETRDMLAWASTKQALKDAFKKALGGAPADKHFREAKIGELLLVENHLTEWLEFKVKPYSARESTSSYTSGYGWRNPYTPAYVMCAGCGCPKYWHSGFNDDGRCLASVGTGTDRKPCSCEQYVSKHVQQTKTTTRDPELEDARLIVYEAGGGRRVYVTCDGCFETVEKKKAEKVAGYYLCQECWDDGEEQAEKMAQSSSDTPDPAECSDEDKLADLFEEAIKRCALKLGTTVEYVHLLVTEPDSVVSEDPALVQIASIVEEEYQQCEEEVWQEMLAAEEAASSGATAKVEAPA